MSDMKSYVVEYPHENNGNTGHGIATFKARHNREARESAGNNFPGYSALWLHDEETGENVPLTD